MTFSTNSSSSSLSNLFFAYKSSFSIYLNYKEWFIQSKSTEISSQKYDQIQIHKQILNPPSQELEETERKSIQKKQISVHDKYKNNGQHSVLRKDKRVFRTSPRFSVVMYHKFENAPRNCIVLLHLCFSNYFRICKQESKLQIIHSYLMVACKILTSLTTV